MRTLLKKTIDDLKVFYEEYEMKIDSKHLYIQYTDTLTLKEKLKLFY